MKMHRFFVEEKLEGKEIRISDADLLHQWRSVFRFRAGDKIILLDNSGYEREGEFVMLARGEAALALGERRKVLNVPTREITLYQALPKKDVFETILRMGTEIGVSHFVPVIAERSEKKGLNMFRARKIIREAAEQSGRGTLPTLSEPVSLSDAINNIDASSALALDPTGENFQFSINNFQSISNVPIFIGPEGGWSLRELQLFREKKIPIHSLGSAILRCDTAAVAVASRLLLQNTTPITNVRE